MSKHKNLDLLQGELTSTLIRLALPIMSTGFVQMAYSLTDTIWLGRVESGLVAAGTCGMLLWFSDGLNGLAKIGGQINTAHELGAKRLQSARSAAATAVQSSCLIGLLITLFFFIFGNFVIDFFKFANPHTVQEAGAYLKIVSLGIPFAFAGRTFSAVSMANGNSKLPFILNTCGLIANIILDPLFIFVFNLGVSGAAWATILAQISVCCLLFYFIRKQENFENIKWYRNFSPHFFLANLKLGLPITLQTLLLSSVAMGITKIVNNFSEAAIAAQRLGVQIESLSWLTAESFGGALTAIVAQNYAANQYQRTWYAIKRSLIMAAILGVFTTSLLYIFPEMLVRIFNDDPQVLPFGVEYLQIIAYSQIFMCIEIVITSAFSGFGKTKIPALVNAVCIGARIPLAALLSTLWGTKGIWWTLTFSSVATSVVLAILLSIFINRLIKTEGLRF